MAFDLEADACMKTGFRDDDVTGLFFIVSGYSFFYEKKNSIAWAQI